MSKKIVVALDGSDESFEALTTGAELASAMGRELDLLYVYPHMPAVASLTGLEELSHRNLEKLKDQSGKDVFAAAEAHSGSRHPISQKHLLWGDPAEEIIAFQEQNPDAHIVMGRRGSSKFSKLLLGSVSDKVLRHASGLVTVVS